MSSLEQQQQQQQQQQTARNGAVASVAGGGSAGATPGVGDNSSGGATANNNGGGDVAPWGRDIEFQVIILAGGVGAGHRLYPLTESEDLPKCMLPVANRPLISYQLELLERAGFLDVMIVTEETTGEKLKHFVTGMYKGKLRVDIQKFNQELSTADVLFHLRDKIKSDFIVISGDLVAEDAFLHPLADIHRKKNSAVTLLLKQRVEKSKLKKLDGLDFIGLTDGDQRVVYYNTAETVALDEPLTLRKALLRKFPNITIYRNLMDVHVYIFSKWVLNILEQKKESISSIKQELIPYLVYSQYGAKSSPPSASDPLMELLADKKEEIGCYAYILPNDVYCARANTIPSYTEINNEVARGVCGLQPWEKKTKGNYFIGDSTVIAAKCHVGPECVIGSGTSLSDQCVIKKSVIGKHCKIANNVKILNSVVMDHVIIGEGTVLEESLVCHNCMIEPSCTLKGVQLGVGVRLPGKSDLKGEVLVQSNS